MLSQKAKYALRALLMLAERSEDDLVMIADIAERENVPRKFLEAILLDLRKRGLLDSRRGKNGGYRLAKPPAAISFGEIIRIVDGPLAPLPCASKSGFRPCEDCTDVDTCSVRWLMLRVRDATADILDNCSLADGLRHRRATGVLPGEDVPDDMTRSMAATPL
jgi:Rrf2 family protein